MTSSFAPTESSSTSKKPKSLRKRLTAGLGGKRSNKEATDAPLLGKSDSSSGFDELQSQQSQQSQSQSQAQAAQAQVQADHSLPDDESNESKISASSSKKRGQGFVKRMRSLSRSRSRSRNAKDSDAARIQLPNAIVTVTSCRSDGYYNEKAPGSTSKLPRKAPTNLKLFHELAVGVKDAYAAVGQTPTKPILEHDQSGMANINEQEFAARSVLWEFIGNIDFVSIYTCLSCDIVLGVCRSIFNAIF